MEQEFDREIVRLQHLPWRGRCLSESERWEDPLVQGMAMGWNLVSGMVVPGGEAGTLMPG